MARVVAYWIVFVVWTFVDSPAFGLGLTLSGSPSTTQAVTLVCDPSTGNLSLDSGGEKLSVVEVRSQSGILTGTPDSYDFPGVDCFFGGHFGDGTLRCAEGDSHKFFVLQPQGFPTSNLDLERIAEPNLTSAFLLSDLTLAAAFLGVGPINTYVETSPHLYIVPEPLSVMWTAVLAAISYRRTREEAD